MVTSPPKEIKTHNVSKNVLMKKFILIFIIVISTGQSMVLVSQAGHPLCDAFDFPCIPNSVYIDDLNEVPHDMYDQNLSQKGLLSCHSGFLFPDGKKVKIIYCETVVDENGMMITQWQKPGACERKFYV